MTVLLLTFGGCEPSVELRWALPSPSGALEARVVALDRREGALGGMNFRIVVCRAGADLYQSSDEDWVLQLAYPPRNVFWLSEKALEVQIHEGALGRLSSARRRKGILDPQVSVVHGSTRGAAAQATPIEVGRPLP